MNHVHNQQKEHVFWKHHHAKLPDSLIASSAEQTDRQTVSSPRKVVDGLCLIDVGGGLRGIYAAGVLDGLLDEGIMAELCIGISAGSANLSSYLAGQRKRAYAFYHDYAYRPEYASMRNFLVGRSFFDFDYIYSTLSNSDGENPLDFKKMNESGCRMISVATNAVTGRPMYLPMTRMMQDDYSVLKASCSVPILCHTNRVAGIPCCDGTVSDPIPVEKAMALGAKKIVILMPRDPDLIDETWQRKTLLKSMWLSDYGRKYPAITHALARRAEIHNRSLALAKQMEKEGAVLIVSPSTLHKVGSLGGSAEHVEQLYQEGYRQARRIQEFCQDLIDESETRH